MSVLGLFSQRPHCGLTLRGIGAQQHFKSDCDLNVIIKRYPDGVLPPPHSMPTYGDFTALGHGLQASMDALRYVSDWFASLPADIRARFDNDPLAAQRFVLDHQDDAIKLGILSPNSTPQAASEASIGAPQTKRAEAEPQQAATTTSPEGGTAKPSSATPSC